MKFYRQCTFKLETSVQTAWIEERGAKIGNKVNFEDDKRFWEVVQVGEKRMPEKEAKVQEWAYTKQRAVSDI